MMRRASRVSPRTCSSPARRPASTNHSGQASTTVVTDSSFSADARARACRSSGVPARMSTASFVRSRVVRPRAVTGCTRNVSGVASAHSSAAALSEQTISAAGPGGLTPGPCPGASRPSNSHTAPACSTAGGLTNITARPRSKAACPSFTAVTRSSVVKGRVCVADGSFGAGETQSEMQNEECRMKWPISGRILLGQFCILHSAFCISSLSAQSRPRARDLGIVVGVLPTGPLNAITDVSGVRVGQVTIARGDSINTGVTAILPHDGNVFRDKVPAAVVVGNAFGKLAGSTQVNELGELESPIVLTCTLCVPRAADAVLTYLIGLPGNEDVRSANPVVGETNDGFLNDIRARPITEQDVLTAIRGAQPGPVAEGAVGAGRGTIAFGWKGGIGTASRKLPAGLGGYTVGVLVQSNFGGILAIAGAPVGVELGQYY